MSTISQIPSLKYILEMNTQKQIFGICSSSTSFSSVYPTGRHYKLLQSFILPCTKCPSGSQDPFPWPAPAVTLYLQLEKEFAPVVEPPLTLFMHWRGGDEVAGNRELGGAQMSKYCRNENRKTVPNCVKFVDHDTF